MPGSIHALEELQRSAAAGGDVGHLIGKAQLLNSSCGVAAADDGDSIAVCECLGHSNGAAAQGIGFSNTPIGPFQTTVLCGP